MPYSLGGGVMGGLQNNPCQSTQETRTFATGVTLGNIGRLNSVGMG